MSTEEQEISAQRRFIDGMNKINSPQMPTLVYVALGTICLGFWAIGTSVQVLTSEAWMMGSTLDGINFSAYTQVWDAFHGRLDTSMMVPFFFAWGVQVALILASVGVELPKKPAWRFRLAKWSCIILIIANSCGDFAGSAKYGVFGQLGFSAAIFFLTFVVLLFAIMSFKQAFHQAKLHAEIEEKKK